MTYWYVVAHCEWLGPNFGQAEYIDMGGYEEGTMGSQKIENDGESGDPFLSYGISTPDEIPGTFTYGLAQMEIGLLGSHRIRINSSGIYGWNGDSWENLIGQHNRDISPILVIAQDAHTAGDNNVYRQTAYINHGKNSKTSNRSSFWHFKLPNDYVDGENVTAVLHYIIGASNRSVSYLWFHGYMLDGGVMTNASTPSGIYTSAATVDGLNIETSTITGTNLVGGCHIRIALRIQDLVAIDVVKVIGISLIVPVNTRD